MTWAGLDLVIDPAQLAAASDEVARRYLRAGKDTIVDTTKWLERALEDATRQAVPGNLWRAWGSAVYPRGAKLAQDPAGEVFVSGGRRSHGAMTFWTQPGRITGVDGGWIAIPLPAAGPRGRDRMLTPVEWEARHNQELRPVYRRGRAPILVADNAVLSGKAQIARPNTPGRIAKGRGSMTIPIFVLLPFQDFANTVAVEPLVSQARRMLVTDFVARVGRIG